MKVSHDCFVLALLKTIGKVYRGSFLQEGIHDYSLANEKYQALLAGKFKTKPAGQPGSHYKEN